MIFGFFALEISPWRGSSRGYEKAYYSKNLTVTPERTFAPKSLASQLVKRIQPCEAVLEINDGFGVPCIPNDFLLKPIQILPTGPFGPGGKLSGFKFLPWIKLDGE